MADAHTVTPHGDGQVMLRRLHQLNMNQGLGPAQIINSQRVTNQSRETLVELEKVSHY